MVFSITFQRISLVAAKCFQFPVFLEMLQLVDMIFDMTFELLFRIIFIIYISLRFRIQYGLFIATLLEYNLLFNVYKLVIFSTFTGLCNHHHNLILEHFHLPQKKHYSISSHSPLHYF